MARSKQAFTPPSYYRAWGWYLGGIGLVLATIYYVLQILAVLQKMSSPLQPLPEEATVSDKPSPLNRPLMEALCEQLFAYSVNATSLCLNQLGNAAICDRATDAFEAIAAVCLEILTRYFTQPDILVDASLVQSNLRRAAEEQGATVVAQTVLDLRWNEYQAQCTKVEGNAEPLPRMIYVMKSGMDIDFTVVRSQKPLLQNHSVVLKNIWDSFLMTTKIPIFRYIIDSFAGQLTAVCARETLVCSSYLLPKAKASPESPSVINMLCQPSNQKSSRLPQHIEPFCIRFFSHVTVVGRCDDKSRAAAINDHWQAQREETKGSIEHGKVAPGLRI